MSSWRDEGGGRGPIHGTGNHACTHRGHVCSTATGTGVADIVVAAAVVVAVVAVATTAAAAAAAATAVATVAAAATAAWMNVAHKQPFG